MGDEKVYMTNVEELRGKLHSAMQLGNKEEILKISQELDSEILKFLKESRGQVVHSKHEKVIKNSLYYI